MIEIRIDDARENRNLALAENMEHPYTGWQVARDMDAIRTIPAKAFGPRQSGGRIHDVLTEHECGWPGID